MTRPTCIDIHLDHLLHNFRVAQTLHSGRLLAVVKANAYGHQAVPCARALRTAADGFAVATLEEALQLRGAGIKNPIVLLEGLFEARELPEAIAQQVTPVFHTQQQLEWLAQVDPLPFDSLWIKVDTGMHRLGFPSHEVPMLVDRLYRQSMMRSLTLMTHFAHADGQQPHALDPPMEQMQRVLQSVRTLPGLQVTTSLCNSGAILGYPEARGDWGRPGLMLYGVDPAAPAIPPRQTLKPVMTLTSRITAVNQVPSGASVGYGALFTATRPTRVGIVPCGYADGYPRCAAQGTMVLVDQARVPLIGRVSMDMLCIDLTDHPTLGMGAPVELWGTRLPVAEVARAANTVAYELLCHVRRASLRFSGSSDATS